MINPTPPPKALDLPNLPPEIKAAMDAPGDVGEVLRYTRDLYLENLRLREESTRATSAKCPGAYRLYDDLVVCRLCGMGEEAHALDLPDAPGAAQNRFGVDVEYLRKELKSLSDSLENRPGDEIYRYLVTLANVNGNPTEAPGHLEARGRDCWVLFRQMDAHNNIPVEVRHYNPGNDFLEGDKWVRMVEAPTEEAGTPAPVDGA